MQRHIVASRDQGWHAEPQSQRLDTHLPPRVIDLVIYESQGWCADVHYDVGEWLAFPDDSPCIQFTSLYQVRSHTAVKVLHFQQFGT